MPNSDINNTSHRISGSANESTMAAALQQLQAQAGIKVRELCTDSRSIRRDDAFVACRGLRTDGRDYIAAALQAGACGVFWDPECFSWPAHLRAPNVPVENLSTRAGWLADAVYESPSAQLSALAITGTNGKTTASHFVAQLLAAQKIPCGIIGTLGAGVASLSATDSATIKFDNWCATANTTPEAVALHRHLRDFITEGARAAVLEASSHGIAQERLAGARIKAAALINIGRDHLDYHGTMEEYRRVKMRLLQAPELQIAVLNADADFADADKDNISAQLQTFGKKGNAMRLLEIVAPAVQDNNVQKNSAQQVRGQMIKVDGICGRRQFFLPFGGRHNADNFMTAALLAHAAGADWDDMHSEKLTLPCGRLQRINFDNGPTVFVDYAHTPDALSAALIAARADDDLLQDEINKTCKNNNNKIGKLWVVFGCGGERDIGKRAQMGKIAAALADVVIVTDDNPRHESAVDIRGAIIGGAQNRRGDDCEVQEIAGRETAIAAAINQAALADVVLIAGKGHEEYQEIQGERLPFSDIAVAAVQLKIRGGRR